MLAGSTRNISQAEYDQARSLLGDEYDETLSQYVTVAGETEQEESAEAFQTAQEDAAELATPVKNLRPHVRSTRKPSTMAIPNGHAS